MAVKNMFNLFCNLRTALLHNILLALCLAANAQQGATEYSPANDDTVALAKGLDTFTARYKTETDTIKGDYAKYTLPVYKTRFESLKELFDKKQLLTIPKANAYLNAVATQLIMHNQALQGMPVSFWFCKSGVANAQAMGEGAVIVNIGLLVRLDDEAQLAFVLAHELAHQYLKHGSNSINRYVTALHSLQTQKQLKHIKNSEFNKRSQLDDLLKNIQFDGRRHSRDHEGEADSLAVVFMKNTNYDTREALGCLRILDSVDTDPFDGEKFMRSMFTCKEYPFKDKWLAREEGLLGGYANLEVDKQDEDSLKTHPDCKARIAKLAPAADIDRDGAAKFIVSADEFTQLKQTFPYEIINGYYQNQNYTRCLYRTFKMLSVNPNSSWAVTMVGQAFNGITGALQNHKFGNVVDVPGPAYASGYNTLLQFMQNLTGQEIVAINYYYLKRHRAQLDPYAPFEAAFMTSAKNMAQQQ